MNHNILIIGGTSGLGLEMAIRFSGDGNRVFVTGRKNPEKKNLEFVCLDITDDAKKLSLDLDRVVEYSQPIHFLVYAAGFYENGLISDLSDSDIAKMDNAGIRAPAMLLQRILRRQNELKGLIAITSTSQWIPRPKEPTYTTVKAGLAMLANSISLDSRVGKVLVVGPSGMNTEFWKGHERQRGDALLDPAWVAARILELYKGDFDYCLARILRNPPRVELLEQR